MGISLPLVLAALGQNDAERPGGDSGVLEKQFVEIAHPIEQERTRILRLDRAVLRHHRRKFLLRRRLQDGVGVRFPGPRAPAAAQVRVRGF